MKIIYWSDFNCPYSYIGLERLKNALKEFDISAEWKMKSFELEPDLTSPISTTKLYTEKFAISFRQAKERICEIERIAKNDGLDFKYRQISNSRDAHRLVKYCQTKHPEITQKLIEKIYEANFKQNEILSRDVLIDISSQLNLERKKIESMLSSNLYHIEVELDLEDALLNGITAIPCYALYRRDERLIIPGVLEKEYFITAIGDLLSGNIENKTFL